MSYQVLARKWRPKSFSTLVGQEAAVTALSNALNQQRLHHAYLFTGTRGVGKTTIARILAKALNCETGISAEPCGQCSACMQIDAGRFVDLIELDAASNTGVDNIREVLDNAQYAPTSGRYKVYIIDEVHMLSKSAFNAMLKTLEEPPGHVKFILATTDPQKVPVTVLSRCLQFNLRPMTPSHVANHLAYVLGEEKLTFEPEALRLLALAANGSMRDALSLLDQAIAYGGGNVPTEIVRTMLGSFDRGYLDVLLKALLNNDGPALIAQAAQMEAQGADWDSALQQLAELFQWIAIAQLAAAALPDDLDNRALVEHGAQALTPDTVQLYYQIALHGRRDLPLAPDPAAGFRMSLMRLLAFYPAANNTSTQPSVAPKTQSTPAAAALHAKPGNVAATSYKPPVATPSPAPVSAPAVSAPETPAASPAPSNAAITFDGNWTNLILQAKPTGMARMLANEAELQAHDNGHFELIIAADKPHLRDKNYVDSLCEVLKNHLGSSVRITVSLGATQGQSLAAINQQNRADRQRDAEGSMQNDPFVQALQNDFDAQILDIKPI